MESHVRIDEGVKRGPRKAYRGSIKKRNALGQVARSMPANLLPAEVIDRYLGDERTADIAVSYGIARSRLNQWLLEHAEDAWKKAQVSRAVTALEQAKDDLAVAEDPLTLARAREQLRGAQWELERLYARIFGQQTHVTVEHVGDLADRLRRARERVIDATAQQVEGTAMVPVLESVITSNPQSTQDVAQGPQPTNTEGE